MSKQSKMIILLIAIGAAIAFAYVAGSKNLQVQVPSIGAPAQAAWFGSNGNSPAGKTQPLAAARPSAQAPAQGAIVPLAQSRQTALVTAASRVSASVASIGAERPALVRYPGSGLLDDSFLGPFPFYQKIRQKVPFLGSGIILDSQGNIATNYHVVEGADRLFVTLGDKREYEAKLVDYDEINDIAFLKIDAKNLKPAPLGDSGQVMLAEWVLALGNPYGSVIEDPTPTITAGVVSARNRFFHATAGSSPRLYEGMIQTDAAINPGNSGGALANASGEVIGMNTFILSETGGSIGMGFAIPINKIKRMAGDIQKFGRLRKGRVDFLPVPVTPGIQRQLGLSANKGVLVYQMERGGSAEAAGIQLGDVILDVNGRPVGTREDFLAQIFGAPVGTEFRLKILREGKTFEAKYRVLEQTPASAKSDF